MTDQTPTDRIIADAERTVGYPLHPQVHRTAEAFAAATGLSIEMIEAHGIKTYNSATGVRLHVLRQEGACDDHAWTWLDGDRMVCDTCGAEKLETWNPRLGVYESTVNQEGA